MEPEVITASANVNRNPAPANDSIKWNFPGRTPRGPQTEALGWLNDTNTKLRSLGAPTGSGKSGIGASIAESCSGIVLVPQKMLQDQYQAEWPAVPILKGSSNYPCKGAENCKIGGKLSKVKDCRKTSPCGYVNAKNAFTRSQFAVTNYACYFALKLHDPNFDPGHRFLVCDESHNLDGALIDAATLSMKRDTWVAIMREELENPLTVQQAILMLSRFRERALDVITNSAPSKFLMEVEELCDSISITIDNIDHGGSWILCREFKGFALKPLDSTPFFHRFIGSEVVLMSATPPPEGLINGWVGKGNWDGLELDSVFPIDNRRVRYVPVGRLNRDNLPSLLPKLLKRVERILDNHPDEKGIIHCVSYKLGEELVKLNNPRLLIQNHTNREEILEMHARSNRPTVLVSPSMTEGIDLKDDQGRFNIIMKVPYPSLGDAWVKARQSASKEWYSWSAARDIVQAAGRTTRHENDWSTTYILDGSFGVLFDMNFHLFPRWFTESVTE